MNASPLTAALAARDEWLAKRDQRSRRSYEHALRRCSVESAQELVVSVGMASIKPAERFMPRIGAALRGVTQL